MSLQTKRRSNIFTSLRQRTSFKDLHSQLKPSQLKPSRSFTVDKPLPLKPVDLNRATYPKKDHIEAPASESIFKEEPKLPHSIETKKSLEQDTPKTTETSTDLETVIKQNSDNSSLSETHCGSDTTSSDPADALLLQGNGDKSNKRLSAIFKARVSPSSEKTLTTLPSNSDLGSLDTLFMDNPSFGDMSPDSEQLVDNIKHLNYTGYIDMDEPSTPSKLRRTSNYGNISQFVSKDGMVPISNRTSLQVEAREIETLKSKITQNSNDTFSVRLIENAFTMTFFHEEKDKAQKLRFWDDLDFSDALKSDWDSSSDPLIL